MRQLALPALAALALAGTARAQDSDTAALRAEVAALRAENDIRDLMHAYGRTIDARDFAAFGALWTDSAEYFGGGAGAAPTVGGPAIADFMQGVIAANPSGFGEPNAHVFFNEDIDVDGDTATATSMSAFVTTAESGPVMSILARYEDEFVLRDRGMEIPAPHGAGVQQRARRSTLSRRRRLSPRPAPHAGFRG